MTLTLTTAHKQLRGVRPEVFGAVFAVIVAGLWLPQAADAAVVFSADGLAAQNSGAGCTSFVVSNSTGVQEQATCDDGRNSVAAKASADGLGAFASVVENGGSSESSSARGYVRSTFLISGPTGVVDVSLNLVLSSNVSAGGGSILIDAGLFGFGEVGKSASTGLIVQRNGGLLLPDVNCVACAILSQTRSLETNRVYDFFLLLSVTTGTTGAFGEVSTVDAMNTLTFSRTGFVFNLPEGYSASIEGMNVVDNRVVGSVVPLPPSLLLLSSGFAGLAWLRRRRRSLT